MGWRLADITPRKLVLNDGFINAIRKHLHWPSKEQDPVLSNLHPSPGNLNHVLRLIEKMRKQHFPHGTGLEGMPIDICTFQNINFLIQELSEVGKEGWTQMETQKGDTEGDTNGRVTKGGNYL